MEKIGVVICNYNKEKDVLLCIQSVIESIYQDYHVYVVDNASTDRSVEFITREYGDDPRITLLVNEENLGGSGGFNTGVRRAVEKGHQYVMCVDNDALLDENCIGTLMEFLEEHPESGMAAAKIYHTELPEYVQNYGTFIDFQNYRVDSTYANYLEDGSMPELVYSDAVPACALMVRTSLIEQIGLMPEENFLYWDDTEWCYRCRAAGYKVASVGGAKAFHQMGAKKEEVNTFPTYYAWRNWIVFFLQHIEEEQLDDMAEAFLGSIFEIVYEGLYRGEPNKSKTVMAAVDDALHGVMGKAGPERIFDLEFTYDKLKPLLEKGKNLFIEVNDFPLFADAMREEIEAKYPSCRVVLSTEGTRPEGSLVVSLCESIFRQDDLSLEKFIMDLDGNVLRDEDDVLMAINYNYSRRAFIFAQKPLFIRLAKALRY